ncbi:MAG TPA: SH3 domain-containing protein [Thermoflexia bacterium]|nr:SH3 domain-containing protein [Thermoflexia bacterium]
MTFRMRWPTEFDYITQAFGKRPEYYGQYGLPGHEGIDFRAPTGSKIFAVADGFVSDVRLDGNSKPYGNQVRVQHESGYQTIYAHLLEASVSKGQAVKAGQLVGIADNSGNSAGAHLHLTLKKNGATARGETNYPYDIIDPTPYLKPFAGGEEVAPEPPAEPFMEVQVHSPEAGHLNVRAAPYVSSSRIAQVADGAILGALEEADIAYRKVGQVGQWLWVRLPDGKDGYVAAWYLRLPVGAMLSVVVASPQVPLKLRSGPGVEHDQLAQMPDGMILKALEPEAAVRRKLGIEGEWLRVQTPAGKVGYTAAWYLQERRAAVPAPPPPPEPAPMLFVVVVDSPETPLKLRSGPGIEHEQIGQFTDGTVLKSLEAEAVARQKLGQQGAWLQVRAPNGLEGYTAAWYLDVKHSLPAEPEPSVAPTDYVVVESPDYGLRLRSGAGTDHGQVGWVSHGTVLKSLEPPQVTGRKVGEQDKWLKVRTPARLEGYVAAWFLRAPAAKDERVPATQAELPFSISPHIFGMHAAQLSDDHKTRDPIRALFQAKGKKGWTFFTELVARRPQDVQLNQDWRNRLWDWAEQGYGVIVRLNHGYHPSGTLPESQYYDEFAAACARWVELYLKRTDLSPHTYTWTIQIANEQNNPSEHPGGYQNPKEHITPELYAEAFNKIYARIKQVLPNAAVCPGAIDPYNSVPMKLLGHQRWRPLDYFQKMLAGINELDGLILHAYTHGPSLAAITHLQTFGDAMLKEHYFDFQTYRQFMERIPAKWKDLPVYITESNHVCRADNAPLCNNPASQGWTNDNIGWVRKAYEEINNWNQTPYTQQIRALLLYRWMGDQWRIRDKAGIQEDFKQAMHHDYRWRTAPQMQAVAFSAPGMETFEPEEERSGTLSDNLQQIWGLGAKSEALLKASGVNFFKQLGAMSPAEIKGLLAESGFHVPYVATWPEQARLAAAGDQEGLRQLQQERFRVK